MPAKATVEKAKRSLRAGQRPSSAAGEFVREEIHHVREGKHGARSTKQAIAIGLAKARRAGVPLKPPKRAKRKTRTSAQRAYEVGQGQRKPRSRSRRRSRAVTGALRREPRQAASHRALSRQAHQAARARSGADRSRSARKAARTRQRRSR